MSLDQSRLQLYCIIGRKFRQVNKLFHQLKLQIRLRASEDEQEYLHSINPLQKYHADHLEIMEIKVG